MTRLHHFFFAAVAFLLFFAEASIVSAQTCASGGIFSPGSNDIKLKLDPGDMPNSGCWPLGTGIPLERGQLTSINNLAVAGKNQGKVSAQFEARNLWDDGSIKWLWIDFLAEKDQEYYLTFNASPGPVPSPGITATENSNEIQVDTGAVTMKWLKDGATPSEISQNNQVIATSQGDGVYVINQHGTRAALKGTAAELDWQVETSNSVRTVIRVEGWYVTEAGDQLARAIVRYHLYAGQPWAKVDHTFVITEKTDSRDASSTWFQEVGIDFPLQNGTTAIFEKGNGDLATAELASGQEAYVFQEKYPSFHHRDAEYKIMHESSELDSGAEAKGWSALESGGSGVILAIKEFAPQFPKEIAVNNGKITAKLWSNRGGWELDYTPNTLVGNSEDAYWGEWWVDKVTTSRMYDWYTERGFNGADDMRGRYFSPVGTSRTHELILGYYSGQSERGQGKELSDALEKDPIVYPDPSWTVQRDQFVWPIAVKGEAGSDYEDVENFIETWVDMHMLPEREFWTHSSWYDWGDLPGLDYQSRNGTVYKGWYRLHMTSMYGLGKNMWWAWARSGNRDYLDILRRLDRRLSEIGIIHWNGGRYYEEGGLRWGNSHMPVQWSGSGTLQMYMTHRLAPMSYEYLFFDSRWILDALELTKENHIENFTPTWRTTKCGEADVINNLMALYQVFGEPFGGMAKELFENASNPDDTYGLDDNFYDNNNLAICPSGRRHHGRYQAEALVEFYEMFKEEYEAEENDYAFRVAKKAAHGICMGSLDSMPIGYTETRAAMCARYYKWTGEEEVLEPMFMLFNSLRDMIEMFNELPPEEVGANHFAAQSVHNGTTSEFGYSFPSCRFNTWRYLELTGEEPGSVHFGVSNNASVLQTLPTVLDIMPEVEHLNTGETRCRMLRVFKPDGATDNSGSYDINYSLYNAEYTSGTTVDFYYDSDSSGFNGTAIDECQDQPMGENLTCSWDTSELPDGDYWVYGRVSRDEGNNYSVGKLTIGSGNPADVNSDTHVNIKDIQEVIRCIINSQACNFPGQSDVNGDGNVNIKDIQEIIRKIISP